MNSKFHRLLAATGFTVGTGIASFSMAQPNNVLFIDGGYAEMCSSAASSIQDIDRMPLTGSRLGVSSMQICTMAIEDGEATLQQRAASYNNRGVLFFGEGNYEAALQDFDAAVAIDDHLAQSYINRGYTLNAMKRWPDSISAFDKAVALGEFPEPDKVYFNRGIAHEESGNLRGAYFDYKKAAELNPMWDAPKNELTRFTVTRK